jgi:hypothetical protein
MYLQKNKWTTAKKQTYNGNRYDSGFEGSYAKDLDLLLMAQKIKSWERQVNIDLIVNGYRVAQYRIDFIVHHLDGTTEYIETKGLPDPTWKLKWKIFEATYSDLPDVKLTIVKQRNNWTMRKIKKV